MASRSPREPLRTLSSRRAVSGRRHGKGSQSRRALRVEHLEDRCMLAGSALAGLFAFPFPLPVHSSPVVSAVVASPSPTPTLHGLNAVTSKPQSTAVTASPLVHSQATVVPAVTLSSSESQALTSVSSAISSAWTWVQSKVNGVFSSLLPNLPMSVQNAITSAWDSITTAVNNALSGWSSMS